MPDVLAATLTAADGSLAVLQSTWLAPDAAPVNLPGPPATPFELWGTIDGRLDLVGTAQTGRVNVLSDGLSVWSDEHQRAPDVSLWPALHGRVTGALREELEPLARVRARRDAVADRAARRRRHRGAPGRGDRPLGRQRRAGRGRCRMSGIALTPEVSLVGSGRTGIGISHPVDCNVYLIDGGDELALVDTGTGLDTDAILANVAALGHDPGRIRHLFLTHAHGDHAGGAAGLREQLGAAVYLADAERAALEAADEAALGLEIARRNGYYPEDYRLAACPVDHAVRDGERVRCGRLELQVLATPGHSAGSVCLVLEGASGRVLFAGDTVFAGGKISLLVIPGTDLLALAGSVARLAPVRPAALLPGHGPFPLRDAHAHIERAHRTFESMVLPAQILQ